MSELVIEHYNQAYIKCKTDDLGFIKVVYQGCNEKGFCYPPISKEIQVDNLENF